jgi:hypothetical protein
LGRLFSSFITEIATFYYGWDECPFKERTPEKLVHGLTLDILGRGSMVYLRDSGESYVFSWSSECVDDRLFRENLDTFLDVVKLSEDCEDSAEMLAAYANRSALLENLPKEDPKVEIHLVF